MTTGKKQIVNGIRAEIEGSKGSYVWNDYVNSLKLISQVIFTRSAGFILEFIQNAEDAGRDLPGPGVFEVAINKDRIKISHNGKPFEEKDVKSICGIRSSKKPEQGTLGYLGIGFKSVFKVTDCPQVYSNNFQFKFDRNHHEWGDPSGTPWHVIPLWIDKSSETVDPGKTTFIVPFRESSIHGTLLGELRELRTELYLFLRWIKKIQITDEVSGESWTLEDQGETEPGITTLKHGSDALRFRIFRKTVEVPGVVRNDRLSQEFRANVTKREIAIAFALDHAGNLAPSEAGAMYGGVYSFLPLAESSSGAKFPIQADFLVQPGRDAINYEAVWNQWLLEEVTKLCKEAIKFFKGHDKWQYQFLPAFEFKKNKNHESYEKLFGPKLIHPIEEFLRKSECIPTADGGWVTPDKAVKLVEGEKAAEAIVRLQVLTQDEIAPVLGGKPGLKLAHPRFVDQQEQLVEKVDRMNLLDNDSFLELKRNSDDAPRWFQKLYTWLMSYPASPVKYGYAKSFHQRRYDDQKIILTSKKELLTGGKVFLVDLPSTEPLIEKMASAFETKYPVLHPDIWDGVTDETRKKLRSFLTGYTGVQIRGERELCKEAVLPRILTSSPIPAETDLVEYTRYCVRVLGSDIGIGTELWVLAKDGEIKSAREVFFAKEFKPMRDWETNSKYVPGLSFISPHYLKGDEKDDKLKLLREFFQAGGVKDSPDNGIEEFAVNFAEERLASSCKSVVRVEKLNFGYDLEAVRRDGTKSHVEVKGSAAEEDIELTGNETKAADKYKEHYCVLVVSNIPEHPKAYMVSNPSDPAIGKKDRLTVHRDVWKAYPL